MDSSNNNTAVAQTVVELHDLVSNLLILLSDKEKDVIKKRFALLDTPKHTLEQIGQDFSVTRERVRQIEKSALFKMKRNVFNTSLRHIHDFATKAVKTAGGLMKEDYLCEKFRLALPSGMNLDMNNLHLSLVLHDDLECVGNTINFHPYIREKSLPDYTLKHISNHLVNQMYKYGNVKSLERIHVDLKHEIEDLDFDINKVKSLIDIDKRLILVDNELVGLLEWRHVHPRTLRDKILYTLRKEKKPMHFTNISEKIEEAKFDKRPINIQAVHNELIRHNQFVLIGRGIYALADWGYEGGTVSKVVERILAEKKELSQDEIVASVLEQRQVKKITILLALKNGKVFERVGRKRYRLKKA